MKKQTNKYEGIKRFVKKHGLFGEILLSRKLGELIKDKLGDIPKLKGNYKKYYNDYITFIDRDIKYINKAKEFSKKEKIKLVEDLVYEKTYVECVFRYFQINNIRLSKSKK